MGDVKRNQWVIVLVLAAFALMVWSGYANYKRRKQYAQRQAQGTLVPETANNQSVQQDVAADEGLPDLRGKRAPDFSLRTVEGKKVSLCRLQRQGGADQLLGDVVCALQDRNALACCPAQPVCRPGF